MTAMAATGFASSGACAVLDLLLTPQRPGDSYGGQVIAPRTSISARPLQLRAVRPMSSPRGPALEVRICGIAADGCTVVTWYPCRAGSRGQEPGACPGVRHRGGRGRPRAAQRG